MSVKIKTTVTGTQIVKGKCDGCGVSVSGMTVEQYNRHLRRCI